MREEASAERSRMNDQRYINLHLNTPGYRTYRPAWSMLAWQVTASAEQNDREQFVLERLTDAQKSANTTRGSTPGLINPALGEMAGNRVALPDLVRDKRGPRPPKANTIQTPATQPVQPEQNKRGPRRRRASANNDPATQPVQPAQVPQPAQAPQAPPTSHSYQTQQISESPQGSRFWGVTAAFPVAPTAIGVPFEDPGSVAAIPVIYSSICVLHGQRLTWRSRGKMIFAHTHKHKPATEPLCRHHPFLPHLGIVNYLLLEYLAYIQINNTQPTGYKRLMIPKPTRWE